VLDGSPETAQIRINKLDLTSLVQAPLSESSNPATEVHHSTSRLDVLSPLPQVQLTLKQLVFVTWMIRGQKVHPVWMLKPPATHSYEVV
jgi:hypothetical protein